MDSNPLQRPRCVGSVVAPAVLHSLFRREQDHSHSSNSVHLVNEENMMIMRRLVHLSRFAASVTQLLALKTNSAPKNTNARTKKKIPCVFLSVTIFIVFSQPIVCIHYFFCFAAPSSFLFLFPSPPSPSGISSSNPSLVSWRALLLPQCHPFTLLSLFLNDHLSYLIGSPLSILWSPISHFFPPTQIKRH